MINQGKKFYYPNPQSQTFCNLLCVDYDFISDLMDTLYLTQTLWGTGRQLLPG